MHNIWDNSEIWGIKERNESNNAIRLNQSTCFKIIIVDKYCEDGAHEKDIIPRFRIARYDSISSISRNRSNLSYLAPLKLDEKLSVIAHLPYEISKFVSNINNLLFSSKICN